MRDAMTDVLSVLLANSISAAVLGLLALGVWRLARSAPLARGLALLALLKLVTPPLFELRLPMGEPVLVPSPASADTSVPPRTVHGVGLPAEAAAGSASPVSPLALLFGLWAAGSLAILIRLVRRARRFGRLLAAAEPANEPLVLMARQLARQLGLRRTPRVVAVDARISPSVFALAPRPTIVLPRALLDGLDPSEQRAVLTHELCHLANRDHWSRWIECAVATVHWWNPIAFLVRHLLCEVEELCCDARAVALLGSTARGYGRTILKAVTYLGSAPAVVPLGASGLGGARSLTRRLKMIAEHRLDHRLTWPLKLALSLAAACLLPLGLGAQERERIEQEQVEANEDLSRMLEELKQAIRRIESTLDRHSPKSHTRRSHAQKPHEPAVRVRVPEIHLVTPEGERIRLRADTAELLKPGVALKQEGIKAIAIPKGEITVLRGKGEDVHVRARDGTKIHDVLKGHGGEIHAVIRGKGGDKKEHVILRGARALDVDVGVLHVDEKDHVVRHAPRVLELRLGKGVDDKAGPRRIRVSSPEQRIIAIPGGKAHVEFEVDAEHARDRAEKGSGEVESLRKKVRKLEAELRALRKKLGRIRI